MPSPLILLENHICTATRAFIAEHAKNLKEDGYNIVLIEMNSEISPRQLKEELNILRFSDSILAPTFKILFDMINALEREGIEYRFIDPETREEAQKFNDMYQSAKTETEKVVANLARERATFQRDIKMSRTVIDAVRQHDGGVICIVGFLHHHLVEQLQKDVTQKYHFIALNHQEEIMAIKANRYICAPDLQNWERLQNENYRKNLYHNADVALIEYDKKQSYQMIKTICKLNHQKSIQELPTIATYFMETLNKQYEFLVSDDFIVTARREVKNNQDYAKQLIQLNQYFPKLSIFHREVNGKEMIEIPGLNLPENSSVLKEGFIKAGVMSPSNTTVKKP